MITLICVHYTDLSQIAVFCMCRKTSVRLVVCPASKGFGWSTSAGYKPQAFPEIISFWLVKKGIWDQTAPGRDPARMVDGTACDAI